MDEKSSPPIRIWTHQSPSPSWVTQGPLVLRALTLRGACGLGGGKAPVPLKGVCYWVQACSSSLHNRPVNLRAQMLSQGIRPYSESQLTDKILPGSGYQFLLWIRYEERWGNKVKRPLILQISPRMASLGQGDVFISSFLPSTGGQCSEQRRSLFNSQAEGQDSLRQAIMCDYNNKSNRKQVKQFQHGVKIDLSLQQVRSHDQQPLNLAAILNMPLWSTAVLNLHFPIRTSE